MAHRDIPGGYPVVVVQKSASGVWGIVFDPPIEMGDGSPADYAAIRPSSDVPWRMYLIWDRSGGRGLEIMGCKEVYRGPAE